MRTLSQKRDAHNKDNKKPLLKVMIHLPNCKFNVTFNCEKSQIYRQ